MVVRCKFEEMDKRLGKLKRNHRSKSETSQRASLAELSGPNLWRPISLLQKRPANVFQQPSIDIACHTSPKTDEVGSDAYLSTAYYWILKALKTASKRSQGEHNLRSCFVRQGET
jgi:hypothetical protein